MHTLVTAAVCHHARIRVATARPTEFVDITERIDAIVTDIGMRTGLVNIQSQHTTTAIIVNEHEPLLLADFEALLCRTAPAQAAYRHDDLDTRTVNLMPNERANGHAHCRALMLPSSTLLNVDDGRLQLGRWQRIFLVELDGPRDRDLSVIAFGEGAR